MEKVREVKTNRHREAGVTRKLDRTDLEREKGLQSGASKAFMLVQELSNHWYVIHQGFEDV